MVAQNELDRVYLLMAKSLSQFSTAQRLKVGCLIVKDTHIIAEGVNGMPNQPLPGKIIGGSADKDALVLG